MKKAKCLLVIGAVAVLSQALSFVIFGEQPSHPMCFLNVLEDATIKMGTPTANYGSDVILDTARTSTATNSIYIKFDASGLGGLITDIPSMQAFALSSKYPRGSTVYLITNSAYDTVWSQSTIIWNNAPGNDTGGHLLFADAAVKLGDFAPSAANNNQTVMFTFESGKKNLLIDALNTGDRIVTLVVVRTSDRASSYASRESTLTGAHPIRMATECFFDALNLEYPGLESVKTAVENGDINLAKANLCNYYRNRGAGFWRAKIYTVPDSEEGAKALVTFASITNQTGTFAATNWLPTGEFNWATTSGRMYFFSALGTSYRYSVNEAIAQTWVDLLRAWINQMPGDWSRLETGIRLRSGWGDAFISFVNSPSFDDESIIRFLRVTYEQARYLREYHSETSNWLTFEMAGLYSAGVLFPEWKAAAEWRDYAVQTAVDDLDIGWLPDGVTIELSPGYGTFFSNYLLISDLARETGYGAGAVTNITAQIEDLYLPYIGLMNPEGKTPAFNDNTAVDVSALLQTATNRFPDRQDFVWAASKGRQGVVPDYLSIAFPYAGYLAIRSGWETNANYLCFDAGPVGYRHAHQDKLSLVLWAYGRQILYDPGRQNYNESDPYQNYCKDTFSHSTGLVDNRPQRRKWYQNPSPGIMPYTSVTDFSYSITSTNVWASGVYTNAYGLSAGSVGNDAYPYLSGSNFYEGWVTPARHYRQVAYISPDIFVVQDFFVPNDESNHTYEIRWQLDSLSIVTNGSCVETADSGKPNLAVIPLRTSGLSIDIACSVNSPDIMGWKVLAAAVPASTLRHIKSGTDSQGFVTLLLPLEPGVSSRGVNFSESGGVITLDAGGGRSFGIYPAADPTSRLTIVPL